MDKQTNIQNIQLIGASMSKVKFWGLIIGCIIILLIITRTTYLYFERCKGPWVFALPPEYGSNIDYQKSQKSATYHCLYKRFFEFNY